MPKANLEMLLAQREALEERIKLAKARQSKQEKKDDTRRKILAGAFVIEKHQKSKTYDDFVKELDGFLFRKTDRELFGLAPRDESAPQHEKEFF